MFTRKQYKQVIAAILTALRDVGGDAPAGAIYAALGMDLEAYEIVRDVLVYSGLVTVQGEVLVLTPKGSELAGMIDAALVASDTKTN
jgi:hypothetical protein